MTDLIIAYHVAIVIAFVSFAFFSGKMLGVFNPTNKSDYSDRTKAYAWIAFIIAVLVIIIYMTFHAIEVVGYYNECL